MAIEMTEVKKNADWYYANLDSLLPKYNGKFIGISDCSVVGVFNTFSGGVDEMIGSGHRPGSFIVHQCVGLEEEKKRFFSRMPRMEFRVGVGEWKNPFSNSNLELELETPTRNSN